MKKKVTTQHFPELTSDQLINTSGGNSNPLNVIKEVLKNFRKIK